MAALQRPTVFSTDFTSRSRPDLGLRRDIRGIRQARRKIARLADVALFQGLKDVRCSSDRTILAVEIRKAHGVNFRGGAESAGPIFSCEGEAGIFGEEWVEAEVAGHSNGGLDGIIGNHPRDYEQALPGGTQPGFEVRTDKRAVGPLGDYDLAGQGLHFRLELMAGLAGAIVRGRLG